MAVILPDLLRWSCRSKWMGLERDRAKNLTVKAREGVSGLKGRFYHLYRILWIQLSIVSSTVFFKWPFALINKSPLLSRPIFRSPLNDISQSERCCLPFNQRHFGLINNMKIERFDWNKKRTVENYSPDSLMTGLPFRLFIWKPTCPKT